MYGRIWGVHAVYGHEHCHIWACIFLRSLILYEPVAFIARSEYERQQHRSAQPDRGFLVLYIYLGIVILTWLKNEDHVSIE